MAARVLCEAITFTARDTMWKRASCRHISTSASAAAALVQPAAFLRGAYDMVIGDHPVPELPTAASIAAGDKEPGVLVDVEVVGICGSDMHYYKDGGIGSAKIGGLHSQVAPPSWGNVSP